MGISVYDDSGLSTSLEETTAFIEQSVINFSQGSAIIEPEQARALQDLSRSIQSLANSLSADGSLAVTILGYTSADGNETTNQRLSQQRADAIKEALIAYGIPRALLTARGTGQTRVAENTPADRAKNRSVTFEVIR